MNKKAISPLIATVLLIGFTVALAAIIITWGSNFIEGITDTTAEQTDFRLKCSLLNFKIEGVTCKDSGVNLNEIKIRSNSDMNIVGIILRAIDGNGNLISQPEDTQTIEAFSAGKIEWKTDQVKNPKEIQAIATIIDDNGIRQTCSNIIEEYDVGPKDTTPVA